MRHRRCSRDWRKSDTKKLYFVIGGLVILILAALVALFATIYSGGSDSALEENIRDTLAQRETNSGIAEIKEEAMGAVNNDSEQQEEPYISPIDFKALQAANPDIYGWICITGTDVSYPLVQNSEDDAFYIDHDSEMNKSKEGAIFTEHMYNDTDFTDKATVVYGHCKPTGTMFGQLQTLYSSLDSLSENSEIIVYLPDREISFQVFAAVPYDNIHIMYHYNFESRRMYNAFLNSVYSVRKVGAVFDSTVDVTADDQLLILSTCLRGNTQKRFLVLAKVIITSTDVNTN